MAYIFMQQKRNKIWCALVSRTPTCRITIINQIFMAILGRTKPRTKLHKRYIIGHLIGATNSAKCDVALEVIMVAGCQFEEMVLRKNLHRDRSMAPINT